MTSRYDSFWWSRLIRDDYGGASAAEAASQLVKEMLNAIKSARRALHDEPRESDDRPYPIVQAQREAKEASQKTRARRRARQDGLDLQNLCADLSQGLVASGRSDDGLLPRPSVQKVEDSVSEFYSFSQHRTLVGQELLLCLGYPIWRLDFRGISDAEATSLACRSAAVPAVGVCVAATLAVVGLPGAERISKCDGPDMKCMDHLLSKVETKEEKPEEAKEIQAAEPLPLQSSVSGRIFNENVLRNLAHRRSSS
eukprot:Skav211603  [mRNA]  locus=scaffold2962:124172:130320:- [translate_table: standard]